MSDGGEHLRDGRLVGGRYRLIERIGSGGMGTVWRARDELMEREVAVKQPRLPGDPADESRRRAAHRLYREARAAARVDHPSAVSIHDVVVEEEGEDGLPWIVMELVRGESLHELLRRGPLEPAESARIGLAVLGALRAAHAVGIVHRDVKPANVLLGPPPLSNSLERGRPHRRVVLTDFGIAHIQGEESLTVSGEFVGSLEFIAPERMSGRGAGPASDLWSLGVLLYAAVEGWSPFRRTTLEATLAAILAGQPPEPEQAGPLGPLVVRLLEKDPERRPDAQEVGAVLEAVAEGWPVPDPAHAAAAEPQDPSALEEFGDDAGTVRLTTARTDTEPGPTGPHQGRADAGREASDTESGPIVTGREATDIEPRLTGIRREPSDTEPGPAVTEPQQADTEPQQAGVPEAAGAPESAGTSASAGALESLDPPKSTTRPRRLPVPAPLLAGCVLLAVVLLAGAAWLGVSHGGDRGGAGAAEYSGTYIPLQGESGSGSGDDNGSGSGTPAPESWTRHPEKAMHAVLFLPADYTELARQGGADSQPRLVVYSSGGVDVRLTLWDRAPRTPMGQARNAHDTWNSYDGDANTQYTRTTFDGHEAVLADTAYGFGSNPTRVMELMIRTDDDRMYELRVDMPKGTADEKKGTAVFKAARDRLTIGRD
ncbi:protein kinase [Streptomyces sp. NPDC059582]|uniref:serine/threonine-protein kinase n=1 Tax=Streptomyces sp. NPDC059582 TaxID=3346875 RepID=UPI0036790E7E